jgi:stearoyl-CoA desaturase (delta-9 desaturase)
MTPPPPTAGATVAPEAAITDELTTEAMAVPTVRSTPKPATVMPEDMVAARWEQFAIGVFVVVPFLAVIASIVLLWGRGISLADGIISLVFYMISGLGITVGFHRYFTHGSFKANRALRVALALAGSLAIEGSVITWVADHRRHHAYSDKEGDPHSPWRYGTSLWALTKGNIYAHTGWLFQVEKTNQERFTPDLLQDKDLKRIDDSFFVIVAATLLVPAAIGGLVTWSWQGAVTAFIWGGLVRVFVLHHVTWSINSICHTIGERPFRSRDKSANFWPLAIPSFGESWHNSHHADPTCARHGVLKGQIDISARVIQGFEKLGWATDVRWPDAGRLEARRVDAES